jgi:hypothetical protein
MNTRFLSTFLAFAMLVPVAGISVAIATEEKTKQKDTVFELKEVSIFDGGSAQSLWHPTTVRCLTEPFKDVKYPKFNSKRPLYGKLQFVGTSPGAEAPIYFVLDESGESPAIAEKGDAKKEEKKDENSAEKKEQKPGEKKKAAKPQPVAPKLSSYDRLYIDANRDGDLTNDPVLKPMKNPPWQSIPANSGFAGRGILTLEDGAVRGRAQQPASEKERQAFEVASINIDYGPGIGMHPFKVFPWFILTEREKIPTVRFAAGVVRKGAVKIGEDEFEAILAENALTGRFDGSMTALMLMPKNTPGTRRNTRAPVGYNTEALGIMQRRGDDFYTITAAPLGDKLTVGLYCGPFGVFKIGTGDRKIKDVGFQGFFRSEKASLNIGSLAAGSAAKKVSECKLPVGDYPTFYMTIDYGGLQVSVGNNYTTQGQRDLPHGIRIRADKPFVLDFPNKPQIVFQSPPAEKPLKLGTDVRIATILVDPKLDLMVRGLNDPKRTTKETFEYRVGSETRKFTYNKVFSYDPKVTITNSSGKNVAEGVMPFG